jgi:Protein of unknown function (DUF3105)
VSGGSRNSIPRLLRGHSRLAIACTLFALAGIAGGATFVFERLSEPTRVTHQTAAPTRAGCELRESSAGYPDDYVTRTLPYKIHPPLPVSGWRTRPLAFDVLFHSIFHGYLVITYGPDLPRAQLARLRSWVLSHTRQRVVGTPAGNANSGIDVDVAVWGWEVRCDRAAPSRVALNRLSARRGT